MSTSSTTAQPQSGATSPAGTASGTAAKANPKVGLVSLGCPKALVDSERIMTRLRAEGYDLVDSYDGADLVIVNTCAFLETARDESIEAIGEAMAENGKVVVTGCLGVHEQLIREVHPGVLAVTGPHQYESVMAAVHQALPPAHRSLRRSDAAAGHQADAAPFRLSEDFRRLQQQVHLLHHPILTRSADQPPDRRRDD